MQFYNWIIHNISNRNKEPETFKDPRRGASVMAEVYKCLIIELCIHREIKVARKQ